MRWRRLIGAVAATLLVATALCASASAAQPPWQAAESIRDELFDARTALLLDGRASERRAEAAGRALSGPVERGLAADAPDSLRELRGALRQARSATGAGDEVGLAIAYGTALAALREGAFEVAAAAARADRPARARAWLLIRDFREATRFTRPGVDATAAIDDLQGGDLQPADAVLALRRDLLDAYQARLLSYLEEATTERERGYVPAAAESAALAAGYWSILAPAYGEQRGPQARRTADLAFEGLAAAVRRPAAFAVAVGEAQAALNRFTAAPFTPEEQARRAAQLTRFLDLVPIEYDDGTDGTEVTIPFELQEALAFVDGARSALTDLAPALEERDAQALSALEIALERLRGYAADANEGVTVVPLEDVEAEHERATALIEDLFPAEWLESNDEADFDLIQISLDQMEAAVSAGELEQAEQARLTAYAFFEFGPEIKLSAFDPGLTTEVEGLIWYGARGEEGLAELIAGDRGIREVREVRLILDEALDEAKAKTGEGESAGTVITNAALIVFREGLEAILIIAAITASMVGSNRELRRPVFKGALLALPASALLFLLAQFVLDSLSQYGEKLEAVVGLVAIGVLLLVLNWFFHRVYWTEWIAGHRKRSKALIAGATITTGTIAGLYMLGFTSVFREGFETVLFLQALQLSSGTAIVLAGVSLGLVATAAVGALTFALERKLPYKRMLVVTGVLIALVLFVLVGNTVRTLQGVGWLGITPIDVELPLWMGTWLGVFPTVQTLVAQALSLVFVIGSYYLAEWVSKRRVRPAAPAAGSRSDGVSPRDSECAGPADDDAAGSADGATVARELLRR